MGTILTCKDLIFTHRHSASGMQVGPISFKLEEGESFGIVGESGSGRPVLVICYVALSNRIRGNSIYRAVPMKNSQRKNSIKRSSILINTHMLVFIQLDRYIRA